MSRICFASFEIHPTTPGGCGVLLYNAARALLQQGHEVILVLDVPPAAFQQFQNQDRLALPNADHCRAYEVKALCSNLLLRQEDFGSIYAWFAYRFHHACRYVVATEKPDVIEFADYCGIGHYALSAKAAGLAYANTHLAVRLHNSIQVIEQHQIPVDHTLPLYLMYAMEHSTLRLAETVLYPSHSYLEQSYRPHYEPWWGRQVWSKPPVLDFPRCQERASRADTVLFYGRLFGFKGVDIFVDAALAYLNNSANRRLRFCLVGFDSRQPPDASGGSYQDYLWRKIPANLRACFEFTGLLSWEAVGQLLPRVLFAVFPNYFESFCYAAHELYAAGVPLIVSNIPAFGDYFEHQKNCLVFDGTVSHLARQMELLSVDDALRARIARPYGLTDNPLGEFYSGPFEPSWLAAEPVSQLPSLLVCILADDREAGRRTLEGLEQAQVKPADVVLLTSASHEADQDAVGWLLGSLYTARSRDGRQLLPSEIRTKEALLILRAGDVPHSDYLRYGLETLASWPQIAYVGCWHRVGDGDRASLRTFPIDAAPELVPFLGLSPFSRCLLRTPPEQLLIDLFDPRADAYGELAYLWQLDDGERAGIVIPEPWLTLQPEPEAHPSAGLLAYLVMHDTSLWHKRRLARYALALNRQLEQAKADHNTEVPAPSIPENHALDACQSDLSICRAKLANCRTELDALRNSLTWRVGHPVARLLPGQLLRRMARGLGHWLRH